MKMANELSKLKPFNLEAALKGEKVVTRDGREVTDIAHLPSSMLGYTVVGVLDGNITAFTEKGEFCPKTHYLDNDLFMAPKERVVWANLYKGDVWFHYTTEETADRAQDCTPGAMRLGGKAFPITIEGE